MELALLSFHHCYKVNFNGLLPFSLSAYDQFHWIHFTMPTAMVIIMLLQEERELREIAPVS